MKFATADSGSIFGLSRQVDLPISILKLIGLLFFALLTRWVRFELCGMFLAKSKNRA